jgi:hypothetical protein
VTVFGGISDSVGRRELGKFPNSGASGESREKISTPIPIQGRFKPCGQRGGAGAKKSHTQNSRSSVNMHRQIYKENAS